MSHLIWIVKEKNLPKVLRILEYLQEEKMIFAFENDQDKCAFLQNPLYKPNHHTIEPFHKNMGLFMNEIAHRYNGLCTYLFVEHIDMGTDTSDKSIELFLSKVHKSIQITTQYGIFMERSFENEMTIQQMVEKQEISDEALEKTYYEQYKSYLGDKPYDNISIISFQYHHVWVKKLFFELKYLSLASHIIKSQVDFSYLLQFLYYKYVQTYAKNLA